jgi:serine/threonine-protein kinase 24/25/MST4
MKIVTDVNMGSIIAMLFGQSNEPNDTLIAENGYEIIEELGSGGFGTVYKVKHKSTGQLFAMKKTDLSGIQAKEKVMAEAENGHQLKHQNVVQIYTYFTDETAYKLYQIMELCDCSLNNWFRGSGKNRSYSMCALMFCEIAAGLEYIHEKQFIHRDMKPANILINKGTCKIADFGLMTIHASRFESLSKYYHTYGLGTPFYAAPEQMQDKRYDFKADIFPMGCIMMEFYTELINDNQLIVALDDLRNRRIPQKFFALGRDDIQRFTDAKDLVMSMTECDPNKRSSINSIINHRFFTEKRQTGKNIRLYPVLQDTV